MRYLTITVANPGGLTADMTATAVVGEFSSSEEGNFTVSVDKTMSASFSGIGRRRAGRLSGGFR